VPGTARFDGAMTRAEAITDDQGARMSTIGMKELLEAGVHFGHQTRRWNPKMKKYIFGERNGVYIIDLQKTVKRFATAYAFIRDTVVDGGTILFIGTKRQAQETVEQEAKRCGMYYVNQRWLGGMLTNFQTMRKSVDKLKKLETAQGDGTHERLPKKEVSAMEKERGKLQKILGGIKTMSALPAAVFVIDCKAEHIAVLEANRLGIPVVAIVDTNCDPDEVDYVIPGNDDAIRGLKLITARLADAVIEGRQLQAARVEEQAKAASVTSSREMAELTAAAEGG
jgi:small subunit ribosomal protein S2